MKDLAEIEQHLVELILEEDNPETKAILDRYREQSSEAEANYQREMDLVQTIRKSLAVEEQQEIDSNVPRDFFEKLPDQLWGQFQQEQNQTFQESSLRSSQNASPNTSQQTKITPQSTANTPIKGWLTALFQSFKFSHGRYVAAMGMVALICFSLFFLKPDLEKESSVLAHLTTLVPTDSKLPNHLLSTVAENLNAPLGFLAQDLTAYRQGMLLGELYLTILASAEINNDHLVENLNEVLPEYSQLELVNLVAIENTESALRMDDLSMELVNLVAIEKAESALRKQLTTSRSQAEFDTGMLLPVLIVATEKFVSLDAVDSEQTRKIFERLLAATTTKSTRDLVQDIQNQLDEIVDTNSLDNSTDQRMRANRLTSQLYELHGLLKLESVN